MNDQRLWKTLMVYQPWASMISLGHKTVETRNHAAFNWLAGQQLAIHAGKRYDAAAWEFLVESGFKAIRLLLLESVAPRGAIVAVCRVERATWLLPSDEEAACCATEGLFGLHLADVRALIEPVPMRGKQGVWTWRPPEGWSVESHTRPAIVTAATESTEEAGKG